MSETTLIDISNEGIAARVDVYLRSQRQRVSVLPTSTPMDERIRRRQGYLATLQAGAASGGVVFVRMGGALQPERIERRVRETLERIAAESLIWHRPDLSPAQLEQLVERRLADGSARSLVDSYLLALAELKIAAIRARELASAA